MPMILEGIRVIDWTQWQMGPAASSMLGDLGADVIKIENNVTGDEARGIMKIASSATGIAGDRNFFFEFNNRNKRSLTLNLKSEKGKEIFKQLVKVSDVFIQNFRVGVAERLGLDYETLHKINSKLIYANASGFGPKGPDSSDPAYDLLGQARSGLMTTLGEPDMSPLTSAGPIADQIGAVMVAYGVLAAIVARERYGIGQKVDASLLNGMMWLQHNNYAAKLILGQEFPRRRRSEVGNPIYNYYKCSDGKWMMLGNMQPDRYWSAFCKIVGIESLEKDPRFIDINVREKNAPELIAVLDKVLLTRTRSEWIKMLRAEDILCTPVNSISEAVDDPQVLANNYIVDFEHPVLGKTKMLNVPVQFSEMPGSIRREAPEFGQHTEEILIDVLGYDWEQIGQLKDEGII